jgi:periplasmic protein TonB
MSLLSTYGPKMWAENLRQNMAEHPFVGLIAAAVTSCLVHGIAYASLAYAPKPAAERTPSRVTFRAPPAPPARPEPPPLPPEPPPAPKPPEPKTSKKEIPPAPEPANVAPAPVDLRGVTLTNDSGSGSFSSIVGDGSSFQGPLGPVGPKRPEPVAPIVPSAVAPAAPSLVALADLSEKPVAPALGDALRQNYPTEARRRGLGGSATVEARVDPDGRIRSARLVNESFAGFGDACRKTLVGSRWSAPKDRGGRAVSTAIRYTCRFLVQP